MSSRASTTARRTSPDRSSWRGGRRRRDRRARGHAARAPRSSAGPSRRSSPVAWTSWPPPSPTPGSRSSSSRAARWICSGPSRPTSEDLRAVSLEQRGRDLLVETPYGELPERFEDQLFTPHRPRLPRPAGPPRAQPDASSATGAAWRRSSSAAPCSRSPPLSLASTERRSRSRRLALELVRHGLAHVIASDAHGGPPPARRAARGRRGGRAGRAPARAVDGHRRARGDPGRGRAPALPPERATARRMPRRRAPREG